MVTPAVDAKIDECRTEIHKMLGELEDRIESMETMHGLIQSIYTSTQQTEQRVNNLMVSFSAYAAKSEDAMKGFPDGDPVAHRKVHESRIKREENRAKFWEEMRLHLAKWGMIGVVTFVLGAVVLAFKAELLHK